MFNPKLRTVQPGDAFENLTFEHWIKNVKGRREADLPLLVNQITPIDSWHQVYLDKCNFHLLMPALTPV
jgi:hypothetical protein